MLLGTLAAGICRVPTRLSLPASNSAHVGLQQLAALSSANSPYPPTAIHGFMARKEWLRLHGAPLRRQLATEDWAYLAEGLFFGPEQMLERANYAFREKGRRQAVWPEPRFAAVRS